MAILFVIFIEIVVFAVLSGYARKIIVSTNNAYTDAAATAVVLVLAICWTRIIASEMINIGCVMDGSIPVAIGISAGFFGLVVSNDTEPLTYFVPAFVVGMVSWTFQDAVELRHCCMVAAMSLASAAYLLHNAEFIYKQVSKSLR